jgi:hypothetical protein
MRVFEASPLEKGSMKINLRKPLTRVHNYVIHPPHREVNTYITFYPMGYPRQAG